MARLFVAVQPPDDVLDTVARLPRPSIEGLRWTSRDQWHVTLRFLGHVEDPGSVAAALARVRAEPADAVVGPVVARFGRRILHVPVSGVVGIADAVVAETAGLGQPPEDRPFSGHLTLARVAKGARVDLRRLEGQAIAGRWAVTEVLLMQSHLSRSGARYEVVARHPLSRR